MNLKTPLVSVIVPMYNVEPYIEKCVTSILDQTVQSLELVIVDDGSTDASSDKAIRAAAQDPRLNLIRQENQGVSVARSTGLSLAQGRYVAFVDADDWLEPAFLATLVAVADDTQADMVISTASGSISGPVNPVAWTGAHAAAEFLTADIPVGCWNKLFRREFMSAHGLDFRQDLYMGEGLYFICEGARKAHSVSAVGPVGYHYRLDNAQSATSVPSVEKMRNALKSIAGIDEMWRDGDAELQVALAYQRLWTLFAALVNAIALGDAASAHGFIRDLRAVRFSTSLRVRGNLGRRVKALAFRTAPALMARFAARRGKFVQREATV